MFLFSRPYQRFIWIYVYRTKKFVSMLPFHSFKFVSMCLVHPLYLLRLFHTISYTLTLKKCIYDALLFKQNKYLYKKNHSGFISIILSLIGRVKNDFFLCVVGKIISILQVHYSFVISIFCCNGNFRE